LKGCVFITAADARYGLAMTGFSQVVSDAHTVLDDLERVVAKDSSGLVFIDERLVSEKVRRRIEGIEKRWQRAIVIIPAPTPAEGEPGEMDYGMQLISRVLGYQMKLS